MSASPQCIPALGFVPGPGRNSSIALHVAEPAVVHLMAVQSKIRGEQPRNEGYFDVVLFVVKVEANGMAAIVASSAGVCDRVVTFDRMLEPGVYAILPFSLQQHRATLPALTINVLCESDRVARMEWSDVLRPTTSQRLDECVTIYWNIRSMRAVYAVMIKGGKTGISVGR